MLAMKLKPKLAGYPFLYENTQMMTVSRLKADGQEIIINILYEFLKEVSIQTF